MSTRCKQRLEHQLTDGCRRSHLKNTYSNRIHMSPTLFGKRLQLPTYSSKKLTGPKINSRRFYICDTIRNGNALAESYEHKIKRRHTTTSRLK